MIPMVSLGRCGSTGAGGSPRYSYVSIYYHCKLEATSPQGRKLRTIWGWRSASVTVSRCQLQYPTNIMVIGLQQLLGLYILSSRLMRIVLVYIPIPPQFTPIVPRFSTRPAGHLKARVLLYTLPNTYLCLGIAYFIRSI